MSQDTLPACYPVEIIEGGMYSGKTKELLRRINVWKQIPTLNVVLVKWKDDIRYSTDRLSTHLDSLGNRDTCEAIYASSLELLRDQLFAADVIGIDEAQFFDGLSELVIELVLAGKRVFLSLLNSTHELKPWKNSPREQLAAYSVVSTLTSVCRNCWKPGATCSIKLKAGGPLIECGGSDVYQSACIRCATEHRKRVVAEEAAQTARRLIDESE
jgi:thymidine kinase